ncbi:MAG: ester cyclase [Deltaproteobacteria bacterium]|nr:ester cyclase [Deltaproteobacteria bacterium]
MRSSDNSKSLVRRWVTEVWNKGNLAVANDVFAPTYFHRTPAATFPNLEAFLQMISDFRVAVPDTQVAVQDLFAEDDKVVFRWVLTGTHRGTLFGIAPTNRAISLSGMTIQRVENGKIVEAWAEFNAGGLRQHLLGTVGSS